MVIRQNRREPGGEIDWEPAEQLLLFFVGDTQKKCGGGIDIELMQDRDGLVPARLRKAGAQSFDGGGAGMRLGYYVTVFGFWLLVAGYWLVSRFSFLVARDSAAGVTSAKVVHYCGQGLPRPIA